MKSVRIWNHHKKNQTQNTFISDTLTLFIKSLVLALLCHFCRYFSLSVFLRSSVPFIVIKNLNCAISPWTTIKDIKDSWTFCWRGIPIYFSLVLHQQGAMTLQFALCGVCLSALVSVDMTSHFLHHDF